jgi:hypothetical protein
VLLNFITLLFGTPMVKKNRRRGHREDWTRIGRIGLFRGIVINCTNGYNNRKLTNSTNGYIVMQEVKRSILLFIYTRT